MYAVFVLERPWRFTIRSLFAAACGFISAGLGAQTPSPRYFSWDVRWTGSWETQGTLVNRGDIRVQLPWQDLSLRTQLISTSLARLPPEEAWELGTAAIAGGLYHAPSGSRLLYGILDTWGLSARIRRPWSRALPLVEYHKPSMSDLKTEPSSTKEPETYLYLRSPPWGIGRGFVSARMTHDHYLAYTGGVEAQFDTKRKLQVEGFYTGQTLPPRNTEAWFSRSPPLPERDMRLYALGMVYTGPFLGIASDWAYSNTAAYGRDLYGNLGLRVGNRPWRVSVAVDGAGNRFVGSDGFAPGAGFRLGGRLEYYGKKGRFFRFGATLRGGELGGPFERSSSSLYYRFPAAAGILPLKLSRVSLGLVRNATDISAIEDRYEALAGLVWGPLGLVVSGNLRVISAATERPLPFPIPEASADCGSAALSGELSYRIGVVQFRAKLGYTARKAKEGVWDTSWYASLRGKPGRLSLTIASPELPLVWTYRLTWRLEHRGNSKGLFSRPPRSP